MIRLILAALWPGLSDIGEVEMKKMRQPAESAVLKALLLFERSVKLKLNADIERTGIVYGSDRNARGQFRHQHQASAPGEPPAPQSGDLRKSITHDGPTWDGDEVSGEVGTNIPYARILEFGGVTGRGHLTRILPRPYMAPTFIEQRTAIETILATAVRS